MLTDRPSSGEPDEHGNRGVPACAHKPCLHESSRKGPQAQRAAHVLLNRFIFSGSPPPPAPNQHHGFVLTPPPCPAPQPATHPGSGWGLCGPPSHVNTEHGTLKTNQTRDCKPMHDGKTPGNGAANIAQMPLSKGCKMHCRSKEMQGSCEGGRLERSGTRLNRTTDTER